MTVVCLSPDNRICEQKQNSTVECLFANNCLQIELFTNRILWVSTIFIHMHTHICTHTQACTCTQMVAEALSTCAELVAAYRCHAVASDQQLPSSGQQWQLGGRQWYWPPEPHSALHLFFPLCLHHSSFSVVWLPVHHSGAIGSANCGPWHAYRKPLFNCSHCLWVWCPAQGLLNVLLYTVFPSTGFCSSTVTNPLPRPRAPLGWGQHLPEPLLPCPALLLSASWVNKLRADNAHSAHALWPAQCWSPQDTKILSQEAYNQKGDSTHTEAHKPQLKTTTKIYG